MNFSINHKLRKMLSLILCLGVLCALLTSCMKGDEDPSVPSEPQGGLNLNESQPPETTLPAETEPPMEVNENTATVLNQLNVYVTPSTQANVTGTLMAGDRIEINRIEGPLAGGLTWAYILEPVNGWLLTDYIQMDIEPEGGLAGDTSTPAGNGEVEAPTPTVPEEDDEDDTPTNTVNIRGTVTAANGLTIRSEASTNGTSQGSYKKGETITILEKSGNWGRTNRGWVSLDYVDTDGSTTTGGNTTTNNNTNTNTNTNANITSNGSTTVQFRGIVTAKDLNVRANGSTDADKVASMKYGDRVEILETSGNWGRTSKGWISLSYVYRDGTNGNKRDSGTVTATDLRVRSGPGTGYGVVDALEEGEEVNILEQFTYNGTTWGCIKNGWISLDYVDLDGTYDDDDDDDNDTRTGYINVDGLRVRSGPGTDYDVVGSLNDGDKVTISSTSTVDGQRWAKISQGWVSMAYVDLDDDDSDDRTSWDSDEDDDDDERVGTVTSGLRIRSGAGTNYDTVDYLDAGSRVTITETKSVNGVKWGKMNKGWICLDYVNFGSNSGTTITW